MKRGIALTAILTALAVNGAAAKSSGAQCLKARAPVEANAIPRSDGFEPAACPASNMDMNAFWYDRALGVSRAARAIAVSEIVRAYPEFGGSAVLPGQTLRLVVTSGAIRVELAVEALQPARPGQRLFVKSANGEILSVVYERGVR